MRYQKTVDLRDAMRSGPYQPISWPIMQKGQWVTVGHGVIGRYVKITKGNVIVVTWKRG